MFMTLLVPAVFAWDSHLDSPGDLELGLEYGMTVNPDERFELFGNPALPTGGIRAGYKIHPRVAIVGSVHAGQTSAEVDTDGEYSYYYDDDDSYYYEYDDEYDDDYSYGSGEGFYTRWRSMSLTVGAKADLPVARWFHPYLALSGVGSLASVQMDDDPDVDDNLNQIRERAMHGGGELVGGAEFRIGLGSSGVVLMPYFDVGYRLMTPVRLGQLGTVPSRGLTEHIGVAVRW